MKEINILWFKKDLRTIDNEALYEASKKHDVLPIFIIEKENWLQKSHSHRQWLFCKECLIDLKKDLTLMGQQLVIKIGDVIDIFQDLQDSFKIKGIYSHQETGDSYSYKRDLRVKKWVEENNIPWKEFLQFSVFRGDINRDNWTKLWLNFIDKEVKRNSFQLNPIDIKGSEIPSDDFFDFKKDLCKGRLRGGRKEGIKRLDYFLTNKLNSYSKDISSPETSFDSCSRLSPYISWGCISLREILAKISHLRSRDSRTFKSRLIWHCHFIQKLETQPDIEYKELHPYFSNIRTTNNNFLEAWSEGKTGYPFLDACMRSLNYNGWINFRMRAMLMSFASYNLWIPWQESGLVLAQKFVDYEPGIHWNQCQMQSGTTSINTNRIYNPVKQGYDHDPEGFFIKKWIPELYKMPDNFIHEPWLNKDSEYYELIKTTCYAKPIVDIKATTKRARNFIHEITLKKGYREISKLIYQKHGSRKSLSKKNTYKKKKLKSLYKQFELELN